MFSNKKMFFLILIILSLSHTIFPVCAKEKKVVRPYKISRIKGFLFYEDLGYLSQNIIDNKDFTLWNTIIGEGSSKSASSSMLIEAQLDGIPNTYPKNIKIEIDVFEKNKLKAQKITPLRTLNKNGQSYIPLFVYDTGCFPLTVNAKIIGQKEESQLSKIIPFQCGE